MITPKPKYTYGTKLYLNDNFFVNVPVKVWGMVAQPDPKYRDSMIVYYQCAVKLDGQNITLTAPEVSLTPKPIRRASED